MEVPHRVRVFAIAAVAAVVTLIAAAISAPPARAGDGDVPPPPVTWLALGTTDEAGRQPFPPSEPFRRYVLDRDAAPPKAGDEVVGSSGKASWRTVTANADGEVVAQDGTRWLHAAVDAPADMVVLAAVEGASRFYVNGAGFPGDLYHLGTAAFPIPLRKGRNLLYATGLREDFRLTWSRPEGPLHPSGAEAVAPDPDILEVYLSLPVWNATPDWSPRRVLVLRRTDSRDMPPLGQAEVPALPPLAGYRPVFFLLEGIPATTTDTVLRVEASGRTLEELPIRARGADESRLYTFLSDIDGSVQSWAVKEGPSTSPNPRLKSTVLVLHGAGVRERGHADAYDPPVGFRVVAPTNRGPFGFDWQDWGRQDAYEVMENAMLRIGGDPARMHVAGHSMGGHGTWHLAANDPDRFLSAAPCSGWGSFDHYGGRPAAAGREPWRGADGSSVTVDLVENLAQVPVYVVHGTADDNVPVAQAERMIALLEAAGVKPRSHFQEGAGHWWDVPEVPGAACVSWPGIWDLFRETAKREVPLKTSFVTVDPGVDAEHHWIRIEQPLRYGERSSIVAERDPSTGKVTFTAENVRRVRFAAMGDTGEQHFALVDGAWVPEEAGPTADEKRPERCGPFKRAFGGRFALVVGTAGDGKENRELLERARFIESMWSYRARGHALIVRDVDVLRDGLPQECINVILFGNADTNAAWETLLPEERPVDARRGALRVGDRTFEGNDLGMLFVLPLNRSDSGLVGVFADTGLAGTRLGYMLPVFVSGVGYPDYVAFGPEILERADGGVLAAGWFDHKWRLP